MTIIVWFLGFSSASIFSFQVFLNYFQSLVAQDYFLCKTRQLGFTLVIEIFHLYRETFLILINSSCCFAGNSVPNFALRRIAKLILVSLQASYFLSRNPVAFIGTFRKILKIDADQHLAFYQGYQYQIISFLLLLD